MFSVCFTIEFTAHQLHAQRAGPAANHRDDTDVLGHDWRVKEVGLCAVIIYVAHKNLWHRDTGNEMNELRKKKVSAAVNKMYLMQG